ncbi:hypothetical protein BpHYR1_025144 [Brachionus plicatilis]|uniref:Uncharacterized protein n=1 Tax=Brachionus plicatilis TaxID=10195 RepID=A0A3M7RSA1_BRAPC|nr:hypothetical protein BpHYR1_025144 [Brachionus plicatilis]
MQTKFIHKLGENIVEISKISYCAIQGLKILPKYLNIIHMISRLLNSYGNAQCFEIIKISTGFEKFRSRTT